MLLLASALFACVVSYFGQATSTQNGSSYWVLPQGAISNFSVELIYHTTKFETDNIVLSPSNAWTVLAAVADGALGSTRTELSYALRINRNRTLNRYRVREFILNTTTEQFARVNMIFVDKSKLLEADFRVASRAYDTFAIPTDFTDALSSTRSANQAASVITKGQIDKIVEDNDFKEPEMMITSAAYVKGQWAAAFDVSATAKRPFYDSKGVQTGEVNMMFNRYAYPIVHIEDLQASVIELPYGTENRLSLLIMLPNIGVSPRDMYINFKKVTPDIVFLNLRLYQQKHGNDKLDCYIPRFKVESNLDLKEVLKTGLGLYKLFNSTYASLGRITRKPLYVTKVIHKAKIEVTEDGIIKTAIAPELMDTEDVPKFEANRPFNYLILEKTTNTVLLMGIYQRPYLY